MEVGDSAFMRALLERIDKMIDEKNDQIVNRGAKSFDEYLAMCGSIATLRDIAQTCVDLGKALGHEAKLQRDNPAVQPAPEPRRRTQPYRA